MKVIKNDRDLTHVDSLMLSAYSSEKAEQWAVDNRGEPIFSQQLCDDRDLPEHQLPCERL